jgi:hypothetical protein
MLDQKCQVYSRGLVLVGYHWSDGHNYISIILSPCDKDQLVNINLSIIPEPNNI